MLLAPSPSAQLIEVLSWYREAFAEQRSANKLSLQSGKNRGREGPAEHARQKFKTLQKHACFTPTPIALRAAHLDRLNIKGSLDRRLGFFYVRLPSISVFCPPSIFTLKLSECGSESV